MLSLGIDIGGTSVKVAARDGERWLWTGQSPFYDKPDATALLAAVRAAVDGRLTRIDTMGLCVPGELDSTGRAIAAAVNVPGLAGLPLDDLAPRALEIQPATPVRIINDGIATGYDIFATRKLHGRLMVIALGTGVGAAVIDDGIPLNFDGITQIGQFDVSIAGHDVIGPDGGAGGLEGYIGAPALARTYGSNVTAALAKFTGDEPAIAALVRAIRISHALYRPHHIVLAGGIGIRLGHLLPRIRAKVQHQLTSIARENWTLSTGDTDFHAARGVARMAGAE